MWWSREPAEAAVPPRNRFYRPDKLLHNVHQLERFLLIAAPPGPVIPDVVRLVNTLPEMDQPNELILARLIGHGGLVHAKAGPDGVFRARVPVSGEVPAPARQDRPRQARP